MTSCPRLRPLELFPVELDGDTVIAARDPSGLTEGIACLPRAVAVLAVLCDGTRTVVELAGELGRRAGVTVEPAVVARLVEQLDEALLLEGPRVEARAAAVRAEFAAAPMRAPAHAGASYPGDGAALAEALAAWEAGAANAPSRPALRPAPGAPAGLLAPHIDLHRGGAVYARAYQVLPDEPPDLVVVFGTDHQGAGPPYTLTRKAYDTPLGAVATDADLVDALAREAGGGELFEDELHHRREHAIEFQAIWLRRRWGDAAPPMLPVLCGSLHRAVEAGAPPRGDTRIGRFVDALRRLTSGRRVIAVAAADLAHVGPRFGDPPFGAHERDLVARADREALDAAAGEGADAFFRAVAATGDRFRVCGLAPIWATLAYLDGARRPGALLDYAQCDADERGESFVSVAAMSW